MKRHLLFKSLLLLCALIVGSGSVWADPVIIYYEDFGTTGNKTEVSSYNGFSSTLITPTSSGWKISASNTSPCSITGSSGSCNAYCGGTSDFIFNFGNKLSNYTDVKLSFNYNKGSANGKGNTIKCYISGDGGTTYGDDIIPSNTGAGGWYAVTNISIPAASLSNLCIKFSSATNTNRLDDIKLIGTASGTVTYSVTYNGNGNTSGSVPTDATAYSSGATVTVLGNTGNLAKTHCSFSGWNTKADGTGINYSPDATFSIAANTTLYAKWTDTRTSAGLAWSAESANVQYGADNNIFPTLTNPYSVPVTYTSSSHAAATIDANTGIITLKDYTGKTTISAIFAGNDDYLPQTVTYELNTTKGAFTVKDGIFDFVEAAKQNPLVDYGSGMTLSTSYTTTNKTWIAGNVTMVTSRVSGNGYRWYTDGTLRFYNESKATFSVPSGYVITKIVTTGANFNNANVGTLSGSTWKGASNEVALSATATKNIETITVTYTTENQSFTPAKTYTTLTSAYALDFTNVTGLKAYIATEVSAGSVLMTQVNKVPANTGLVLKATTPGSAVNVPVFDGKNPDNVSANKMAGSATATTEIAENGGYILKDGFFQPATAGTLAAGKAYLAIAVNGARALEMSFDEDVTAIEAVKAQNVENGQYFNLAGQRVAQPTKGLYIVNGKKVIIK